MGCAALCCVALSREHEIVERSERRADGLIDHDVLKRMRKDWDQRARENAQYICYYSDLRKTKSHYPSWTITKTYRKIFTEIATAWMERSRTATA